MLPYPARKHDRNQRCTTSSHARQEKNTNEKNKKIFRWSTVEHKAGEKAACIAREDTVIAKTRSLIVNQNQHEEIPNTHGFLAKCYDKEEESKFTTKQLSPNVQCRNLCKNPRKVNVSDKGKAKAALKSNTTLMRD